MVQDSLPFRRTDKGGNAKRGGKSSLLGDAARCGLCSSAMLPCSTQHDARHRNDSFCVHPAGAERSVPRRCGDGRHRTVCEAECGRRSRLQPSALALEAPTTRSRRKSNARDVAAAHPTPQLRVVIPSSGRRAVSLTPRDAARRPHCERAPSGAFLQANLGLQSSRLERRDPPGVGCRAVSLDGDARLSWARNDSGPDAGYSTLPGFMMSWIEGPLHGASARARRPTCSGAGLALEPADAVFGAEAAVELGGDVGDDAVEPVPLGEEGGPVSAHRLATG